MVLPVKFAVSTGVVISKPFQFKVPAAVVVLVAPGESRLSPSTNEVAAVA